MATMTTANGVQLSGPPDANQECTPQQQEDAALAEVDQNKRFVQTAGAQQAAENGGADAGVAGSSRRNTQAG
jgi:hypothetical protein